MAAIGNNINQADVSLYLNGVKPSKETPVMPLELLKSKIATDISNDGKIDEKELKGEETAFLDAGGTKDQFTSFMKDALGVDTAKFEPKAFSFNPTKSALVQTQTTQANQPAPAPTPTPVKNPVVTPNSTTTDTSKPFRYENPDAKATNKTIATTDKKAISDSGLTVVGTNKYNVASVTSTKYLADIKNMQKSLGVKADGYIGPQTFHKLAVKYDEAVAKGNTAEANEIKAFVEKLNLTAAFPNIKVSGKTMSDRFDEHVTIPTPSLDRSDGVVRKDEQIGEEVVAPVQPTVTPTGTTDTPIVGGTDPTTTPSTVAPTGTTNVPAQSTVTPTIVSPQVSKREQLKKELERCIADSDLQGIDNFIKSVNASKSKDIMAPIIQEIFKEHPDYEKKLSELLKALKK